MGNKKKILELNMIWLHRKWFDKLGRQDNWKKRKRSENKKDRVFEFWRQNQMALHLVIEFHKVKKKRMARKKCLKRYWQRTYPQLMEINTENQQKSETLEMIEIDKHLAGLICWAE